MKLIKMFGLAAMAALMAMAFAGAGSAMAESTALCDTDPGTGSPQACPAGHLVTHVHEVTLTGAKAKLLSTIIVECDVLFLGDVSLNGSKEFVSLANTLIIEGKFTYTECGSCEVEEKSANSTIEVVKGSHETATVTGKGKVFVNCGSFLECEYDGEGLAGTGKGPLLSSETNGSVSLSNQVTHKTGGGFFCPKEAKLDITTTSLSATYITN